MPQRVLLQQHGRVPPHQRPVAHARRYAATRRRALPHRRGRGFFDRAEIRDVMACLRWW
ncbi:MAG: hypothetical protein ACLTDR_15170 [Adlercreutzia equolifaciens]